MCRNRTLIASIPVLYGPFEMSVLNFLKFFEKFFFETVLIFKTFLNTCISVASYEETFEIKVYKKILKQVLIKTGWQIWLKGLLKKDAKIIHFEKVYDRLVEVNALQQKLECCCSLLWQTDI